MTEPNQEQPKLNNGKIKKTIRIIVFFLGISIIWLAAIAASYLLVSIAELNINFLEWTIFGRYVISLLTIFIVIYLAQRLTNYNLNIATMLTMNKYQTDLLQQINNVKPENPQQGIN